MKISVIIPCYNVESYIDRCMASIIAQTIGIDSLEVICIDDASTDDTWVHLQYWEQILPDHILLIRQEVNGRQGTARNIGLQYASADWVSFVDADDWLEPDYFEQLYRPAQRYDCDVIGCDAVRDFSKTLFYLDERDRGEGKEQYIEADTEEKRKYLLTMLPAGEAPWGKIIRKKLLMDFHILFPEGLAYEDRYWVPMLHAYVTKIYVLKKKLYHYFVNDRSTILVKNADYHVDWITVWMMKWAEYNRRGLLREFREELEYDCIQDAVDFMKVIILRYDDPPFSFFQLAAELIREQVPDYSENRYMENLTGVYRTLLQALYTPLNRKEFGELAGNCRECWGYEGM